MSERDALAAKVFPKEWARWATAMGKGASKRRQHLRKAAEIEVTIMRPLRAKGARCGTCRSYRPYPHGKPGEHYCAADSDYHGYVITKESGLCPRWKEPGHD